MKPILLYSVLIVFCLISCKGKEESAILDKSDSVPVDTKEYDAYTNIVDYTIEKTKQSQWLTSKFIRTHNTDSALFYLGRSYATQELAAYYNDIRKNLLNKQ